MESICVESIRSLEFTIKKRNRKYLNHNIISLEFAGVILFSVVLTQNIYASYTYMYIISPFRCSFAISYIEVLTKWRWSIVQ